MAIFGSSKPEAMKKFVVFVMLSLVCAGAFGQRMGVVNLSANFMRSAADYEAGLDTQALMGTVAEILDQDSYWLKVRTPEPPYTAWVNEIGMVEMDETQFRAYMDAPKYICTADFSLVFSEASETSPRVSDLVLCDILRVWTEGGKPVKKKGFLGVMLPSGKTGYVPKDDLKDFAAWAREVSSDPEAIVETALRYVGVPYMWGGTTPKYLDCSGLTRTAFLSHGLLLPRNASQQAEVGEEVDVSGVREGDFSSLAKGDLLFFGNVETRRVTHVAIYIGDGHIVHASQVVRINSLREEDDDYYSGSRRLLSAKRVCGQEDKGTGIISIRSSPFYFSKE